tara:strand:+ start:549 stop:1337 length:789 start_codon:yes stop_codon:yes gene_type:complete
MKGDISINELSFSYPDGTDALANLTFKVSEKERVAILGPNGAGKTTLVMHLNGINEIQKGNIRIGNEEINNENLREIRKNVGIVFQDPDQQLFMPSVYEDVIFGPRNFGFTEEEIEKNCKNALEKVGMYEYKDKAPHHLSLGQKRKVAIATVLASKPKIIVFDEPSSNLDPSSRRELIDIIKSLDSTILLVTHDIPLALELCPRTVVLKDGSLLCDMGTNEFLGKDLLMKEARVELPFGFELHHKFHHISEVGEETIHKHSN